MDNWKVTIPCTLAEAQTVTEDMTLDDSSFGSPSLVASEVDAYADPQVPGSWALHAYFTQAPETAWIETLRGLVPSAAGAALSAELLPDEDWVTLSQAGLEPIRAGLEAPAQHDLERDRPKALGGLVAEQRQVLHLVRARARVRTRARARARVRVGVRVMVRVRVSGRCFTSASAGSATR